MIPRLFFFFFLLVLLPDGTDGQLETRHLLRQGHNYYCPKDDTHLLLLPSLRSSQAVACLPARLPLLLPLLATHVSSSPLSWAPTVFIVLCLTLWVLTCISLVAPPLLAALCDGGGGS